MCVNDASPTRFSPYSKNPSTILGDGLRSLLDPIIIPRRCGAKPHHRFEVGFASIEGVFHHWIFWIFVGYLSGSVPFGLWIGFARGVDIRQSGSGNLGATNTGRVLGKGWGGVCFVLDVLKGMAPVLLSGWVMGCLGVGSPQPIQAWWWMATAGAAILGHVYPIGLGFKGGKGVATGLGVLLGFWPILTPPGLIATIVWVLMVAAFGYVSLASIVAVTTIPLLVWGRMALTGQSLIEGLPFIVPTTMLAILVVVRHRGNIVRLRAGTEPKVGRGN